MASPASNYVPAEFTTYQDLLKFVVHSLNVRYHCPLDRLARYTAIPFSRLDEARRVRTDRKQLELTHQEHNALANTCFHLGAPELGLALMRFGVSDWVVVTEHAFDRDEIKTKLQSQIIALQDIQQRI